MYKAVNNGNEKKITVIKPRVFDSEDDKIRVAAYCRVSTDKSDQINSFLMQMQYYTDYINSNTKMILIDLYADEGITGTEIKKRDEFKRLLKDCKNRKIDRILVKSVTRFARNSLECIEAVRELKSYGVSILFENDNLDTDRMNSEMLLYIKSAFAQSESMSASKRMSTSIRMRMENGTYKNNAAPYGYRVENDELVIVPEEAVNIRKIFDLYISGLGAIAIVKYMQNHEKGKMKWGIGRINYILDNERYVGDMMMRKTYTPNILPLRNRPNKGEEDRFYCEKTHDPIISKETFAKVKGIKQMRRQNNPIKTKKKKFFYGKIRCKHCGWSYRFVEKDGLLNWVCSKKGLSNNICRTPKLSNNKIEQAFIVLYNKLKKNERVILDETISQLQALKIKVNRGNDEITNIDKEMAILCSQNNLFTSLYDAGSFDETIYIEKTDAIKKKIDDLKIRRAKLVNESDNEICFEKLRELKRILDNSPDYITEFSEVLFNKIVKVIIVEENGVLDFVMNGDLELKIGVEQYGK